MKILYLGLEIPPLQQSPHIVHYPMIKVVSKPPSDPSIQEIFKHFECYTHLIFTSRNTVRVFFDLAKNFNVSLKDINCLMQICVGQRTAAKLQELGGTPSAIAQQETAEGIIHLLNFNTLKNSNILLPQSSLARPVIKDWLKKHQILYTACPIYDTLPNFSFPLPNLVEFDQITFTSPSTVDAFLLAYGSLPKGKVLSCIGPITKKYLTSKL